MKDRAEEGERDEKVLEKIPAIEFSVGSSTLHKKVISRIAFVPSVRESLQKWEKTG
jgi:hypothetical protein